MNLLPDSRSKSLRVARSEAFIGSAVAGISPSADEKINDDDRKDDTDSAAPIVSNAGTHVIAPAAENEQKNDEDND